MLALVEVLEDVEKVGARVRQDELVQRTPYAVLGNHRDIGEANV